MADVDGVTGTAVQTDAVALDTANTQAAPVTDGQGATQAGNEGQPNLILELDGQQYTEAQVLEAFDALKNMSKWRTDLSRRGEELNAMARALEEARTRGTTPQAPQQAATQQPGQQEQVAQLFQAAAQGNPQATAMLLEMFTGLADSKAQERLQTHQVQNEVRTSFLGKYNDFPTVTQSQEFREYSETLPKDHMGRPVYNEVNAYFAYRLDQAEKQIEQAKKSGYLAGEQATINNLKAKGTLKVLTGTGSAPVVNATPDVKKMQQGEFLNAATQAILARRAAQGG